MTCCAVSPTSWPSTLQLARSLRACGSAIGSRSGRVGAEPTAAELLQDRLGHDRARRVVRAQEQHVERRGHAFVLLGKRGKQARNIAAQLGTAAAAGLGQEREQPAQPAIRTAWMICRPCRVDCVRPARSSAARWKESVDDGRPSRVRDFSRRQAVRPLGDQQPHQVEPGLLRERRKGSSGFRCFHLSRMAEMTLLNKAGWRRSGRFQPQNRLCHRKFKGRVMSSSAGVGMIRRQQSLLPRCWEARGHFRLSIRPHARTQCSDHHRQHQCGCDGLIGLRALGQKPDAVVALMRGDVGARQPEGFSNS